MQPARLRPSAKLKSADIRRRVVYAAGLGSEGTIYPYKLTVYHGVTYEGRAPMVAGQSTYTVPRDSVGIKITGRKTGERQVTLNFALEDGIYDTTLADIEREIDLLGLQLLSNATSFKNLPAKAVDVSVTIPEFAEGEEEGTVSLSGSIKVAVVFEGI